MKLFQLRVKEFFKPTVFWETDLQITLVDFTVKTAKFGRENILIKYNNEIKMWRAVVNHNHMRHTIMCKKILLFKL